MVPYPKTSDAPRVPCGTNAISSLVERRAHPGTARILNPRRVPNPSHGSALVFTYSVQLSGPLRWCVNISPRGPTCHGGPPKTSKPSPSHSTTDPARAWIGRLPRKYSKSSYALFNNPVLQRPVETSQFTSREFRNNVHTYGLRLSLGTVGDCCNNAMIKSFWGRMQTELLDRKKWVTILELSTAMTDYIDSFHNNKRRHSSLDMLTLPE